MGGRGGGEREVAIRLIPEQLLFSMFSPSDFFWRCNSLLNTTRDLNMVLALAKVRGISSQWILQRTALDMMRTFWLIWRYVIVLSSFFFSSLLLTCMLPSKYLNKYFVISIVYDRDKSIWIDEDRLIRTCKAIDALFHCFVWWELCSVGFRRQRRPNSSPIRRFHFHIDSPIVHSSSTKF